jgi:LmbE family N-acetylglucosaminyl deacetylase
MAFDPLTLLSAAGPGPHSLRDLGFPRSLVIQVLAPHPDDFDAIALSLRYLHQQGHALHVAVLTSGASGVDPGFAGAADDDARAALREAEQRASCALFGLAQERLTFLRLWVEPAGADANGPAAAVATPQQPDDLAGLAGWMASQPADLLFMPHGNDSNQTHRRTFEAVRAVAAAQDLRAWACLNQDAKTVQMRVDLHFDFGAEEAAWKARLLRCHRSQQERNLRTRGTGFDARVLEVNRQAAQALGLRLPYAETFELMPLGG